MTPARDERSANAIKAVDYFTDLKARGVNIVATNNSWGGGGFSQALLAAITSRGARSSFSNYGRVSVDVGAPGSAIWSTISAGPLEALCPEPEGSAGTGGPGSGREKPGAEGVCAMRMLLAVLFLFLTSAAAQAEGVAFVHRVPAHESGQVGTTLNHPFLNEQPDRVVLITPRWVRHRQDAAEVSLPFAVYYDRASARWKIVRGGGSLTSGAEFNVVAATPSAMAWTQAGVDGPVVRLSGEAAADPNRALFVSHDGSGLGGDLEPLEVRFEGGSWVLVHPNGRPFQRTARYSVLAVPRGTELDSVAVAGPGGEGRVGRAEPSTGDVVLCTANASPPGRAATAAGGFPSVSWDGAGWVVSSQPAAPAGAAWNCFATAPGEVALGDGGTPPPVVVAPPPAGPTTVRVRAVDEAGRPVAGASIFLDGEQAGVQTDARGEAQVRFAAGDTVVGRELVARKRVREHESWLDGHETGSTRPGRGWAYRVYRWSFDPVAGQGHAIAAPAQVQVLRLERTLIGFHLVASMNWDATAAEFEEKRRTLQETSDRLYDATDGQFFLELVELGDNSWKWDDYTADYRIWADYTSRAIVWHRAGGLFIPWRGNYAPINVSRRHGADTWTHEFGHYGLALVDEYDDSNGNAYCTAENREGVPEFGIGGAKASCVMSRHWATRKFCSDHPANPHHLPGRANRHFALRQVPNCWTTIERSYETAEAPLRTPQEQPAGIPGTATPPPFARANVTGLNQDLPGLRPGNLVFDVGAPGVRVWVEHRHGPHTYQGESLSFTSARTFSWHETQDATQAGKLPLTGLHVGDVVVWSGRRRTVTADWPGAAATDSPMAFLRGVLPSALNGLVARTEIPFTPPDLGPLQVRPAPASVVPVGAGQYRLLAPGGSVQMVAGTATTGGDLLRVGPAASSCQNLLLKVSGEYLAVAVSPLRPDWESFSYSGDLSLEIPGVQGGSVAISPGDVEAPPPGEWEVVSGPFRVATTGATATTDPALPGPGYLRFRNPPTSAPGPLQVLRFDRPAGRWVEVPSVFLPGVLLVSAQVEWSGNYALAVARPAAASVAVWMSSAVPTGPGAVRLVGGGPLPAVFVVETAGGKAVAELNAMEEGPKEKPDLVAYANGLPPGAYRARLHAGKAASEPLDFTVEAAGPEKPEPAAVPLGLRMTGAEPHGGGAVTLTAVVDLPQGGMVQFLVLGLQGQVLASSEEFTVQGAGIPVSATLEGALEPGAAYEAVLVTGDRSAASERLPFRMPEK